MRPGGANCWNQPEDHGADHADEQREGEHTPIDACLIEARDVLRAHAENDAQQTERDDESRERSRYGKHQTFGEELPDEAPVAGAERGTDRELLAPGAGAAEQEIRDVDARNHQHEAHRTQQDEQQRAIAADEIVAVTMDLDAVITDGKRSMRSLLGDALFRERRRGASLLERDVRSESRDDL